MKLLGVNLLVNFREKQPEAAHNVHSSLYCSEWCESVLLNSIFTRGIEAVSGLDCICFHCINLQFHILRDSCLVPNWKMENREK